MIHAPVKEEAQTARRPFIQEFLDELENTPDYRRRLTSVLAQELPQNQRLRMTYQEFLEWADEDTFAEWVGGEVIMSSPASLPHQDIVDFLVSVIRMFVVSKELGVVISAPFQMKMEHGREPDVLFITREHQDRLKATYLDGPADLVVEVVSPESAGRDRGDKFYEYERGGVTEYWLIDPLMRRAEFYQLEAKRYRIIPIDFDMIYHSQVLPGFWLNVDWLWQEILPHPLEVVGKIAGIDAQEIARFMELLKGIRP